MKAQHVQCMARICTISAMAQPGGQMWAGSFVLSEFKAVVLASLRSLVSTEWDSDHEVPWKSHENS